jgi:hypothetical protein
MLHHHNRRMEKRMSDPDFWRNQRYQDMFYGLHGHFPEEPDYECSLCNEQS